MQGLVIGYGLPGSGKTTFLKGMKDFLDNEASEKKYYTHEVALYFDMDKSTPTTKKFYRQDLKYYTHHLVDACVFTNAGLVKVIRAWSDITGLVLTKGEVIKVHFWEPDVEACLWNDIFRRDADSKVTIKNGKVEEIDSAFIVQQLNLLDVNQSWNFRIDVERHQVVRKDMPKVFIENICEIDKNILTSVTWCLGGSAGNCWDSSRTEIGAEEPCEFEELDELLEKIAPKLTYLQYKRLSRECVTLETKHISDYYDSGYDEAWWQCDLRALYCSLERMGVIKETDVLAKVSNLGDIL